MIRILIYLFAISYLIFSIFVITTQIIGTYKYEDEKNVVAYILAMSIPLFMYTSALFIIILNITGYNDFTWIKYISIIDITYYCISIFYNLLKYIAKIKDSSTILINAIEALNQVCIIICLYWG